MLTGNNGILTRATQAKKATTVADEKEQIQLEVLGSYENNGNLLVGTVNSNIKSNIRGVTTDEATEFPLKVTYTATGNVYEIDENGNVEKAGPTIVVDTNSLTITAENGDNITNGEVPANTPLKINFNASVEGGTITVDPSLPHITTAEEMTAKKVTFTITGSASGETVKPLTYTVDLKDVYKSNVVSMEELKTNANKYFGYDVINYANTLPIIDKGQATEKDYTQTQWQLFYAGALDIDATTATTLGLTEAERTE